MHPFYALLFLLVMNTCSSTTKTTSIAMDEKETIPTVFQQQLHRFEIKNCQLFYNDQLLSIGMSKSDLKSILGGDFETYIGKYAEEGDITLFWNNKSIETFIKNDLVIDINLYLQPSKDTIYTKTNFDGLSTVMFNNTLLTDTTPMVDFIQKSSLSIEDFEIDTDGFSYRSNCDKETTTYFFESPMTYQRKGSGHLYVRGDWNLDKSQPVKRIHIYKP